MDSTDFEDFMDFFWIFSGFFDEVYGIFGVKCPSSIFTTVATIWKPDGLNTTRANLLHGLPQPVNNLGYILNARNDACIHTLILSALTIQYKATPN